MRVQFPTSRALSLILLLATAVSAQTKPPVAIHILDATTQKPIADATVTIAGKVLAPDATGNYQVPASTSTILYRAPGYQRASISLADAQSASGKLPLKPIAIHALYLTEYGIASAALRDPVLSIIRHGGANALVVNIKSDHGILVYPSEIPLAKAISARSMTTIHSLPDLVNAGHAQGIYMIARIVTFKDDPLATTHPELAIHLANGDLFRDKEHLAWADPWQPKVRAYDIAIAVEAAKAGFDEVQFDYVRFPDSLAKLKVSGPTDEPSRVKAITSFLADAHKALIPYNVFQSADIFGYDSWNAGDTGIGQQLEEITRTVDYVCPMLYPSGFHFGIPGHPNPMATTDDIYNIIKLSLDNSITRTKANPKKFRPWLQAFRDYAFQHRVFGPEEVAAQIKATNDDHVNGWTLWNARNVYTNLGLTPAEDKATTAPATKTRKKKAASKAAKPTDTKPAPAKTSR